MKLRKVLAVTLVAAMTMSMAACGGSNNTAGNGGTTDNNSAAADNSTTPATEAAAEKSTEAAGGTVESKGTIKVAASATPHAEILAAAKPILAEQGWDLEVTEFDDYVLPNEVVESGEMDANYFQHVPYLDSFNEEKGTHLVEVGKIHYEPFGIYPGTKHLHSLKAYLLQNNLFSLQALIHLQNNPLFYQPYTLLSGLSL
jgi:D-methionine transport system substrate-binding protein